MESAKLALIHDGRIAQLTFTGALTPEVLSGLIQQASEVYGAHTRGWVSDFSRASVAVPLEGLKRITLGTPPGHVLRRPGAFVAQGPLAHSLGDHVVAVAARGIPREVFGSRRAAVAWVFNEVRPRRTCRL